MPDSFDRILHKKTVYIISDPEEGAIDGTVALAESEVAEHRAIWEPQGYTLEPWTPRKGDLVEFCEDGGGAGQVVKVLNDGKALLVNFGKGQPETWDTIMLDPIAFAPVQ